MENKIKSLGEMQRERVAKMKLIDKGVYIEASHNIVVKDEEGNEWWMRGVVGNGRITNIIPTEISKDQYEKLDPEKRNDLCVFVHNQIQPK